MKESRKEQDELSVKFDFWKGEIYIKGEAVGEVSRNKLAELTSELKKYAKFPNKVTKLHIKLDYFNTSSATLIFKIMKTLELMKLKTKSQVFVMWGAEEDDEDLIEAAVDYQEICPNLNIALSPIKPKYN